jgi:hypothetical protein
MVMAPSVEGGHQPMKQQCHLYNVWFTWLGIPAIAILMGVVAGWWAAPFILLVGGLAQVLYVRAFPKASHIRVTRSRRKGCLYHVQDLSPYERAAPSG